MIFRNFASISVEREIKEEKFWFEGKKELESVFNSRWIVIKILEKDKNSGYSIRDWKR